MENKTMKSKKLLAGCLTAAILTLLSSSSVFGAKPAITSNNQYCIQNTKKSEQAPFGSVTGTVKEITEPQKGVKHLLIQDASGGEARLVITEDTYVLDGAEAKIGDTVTGFYNPNAPMLLIYPPQYNTEILVVHQEGQNVKADLFDENLVSSDGFLKLNVREDTEVITQDGNPFTEKLANKKLLVVYDIATKSIPAQTTPLKIIVLSEKPASEKGKPACSHCQ